MEQGNCLDSTPASAGQDAAALRGEDVGRDAAIAKMLVVGPENASAVVTAIVLHEKAYAERLYAEAYGLADAEARAAQERDAFRHLLHLPLTSDGDRLAYGQAVIGRAAGVRGSECQGRERSDWMPTAFRNIAFGEYAIEAGASPGGGLTLPPAPAKRLHDTADRAAESPQTTAGMAELSAPSVPQAGPPGGAVPVAAEGEQETTHRGTTDEIYAAVEREREAAAQAALDEAGLTSAISAEVRSAILRHGEAMQATYRPSANDDEFDRDAALQNDAEYAVAYTPSQSLADLRAKLTYLIPIIEPDMLDRTHVDHLKAIRDDVDRLCRDRTVTSANSIILDLGKEFDAAHAAWREAVDANRVPAAQYAAFIDAAKKRGRPSIRDVEEAWALPGVAVAGQAEDDTFDTVAELGLQTLRLRLTSIAGLALKARCVIPNLWMDGSYELGAVLGQHEDVHKEAVRHLIESCCAAAGVDWRGQPRAAEADSQGPSAQGTDQHDYAFHGASTELRLATHDHNRLCNLADEVLVEQNGGDASEEAMALAVAARDAAGDRELQAWRDLFKIRPRTNHQMWLLLRDVAKYFDALQGIDDEPDVFGALIGTADGLRMAEPDIAASHDLTLLSLNHLEYLSDLLRQQARVLKAFEQNHTETPFGVILDIESTRLALLGDAAGEEAARRRPTTSDERNFRLESMIKSDLAGNGYIEPALLAEAVAAWGTR